MEKTKQKWQNRGILKQIEMHTTSVLSVTKQTASARICYAPMRCNPKFQNNIYMTMLHEGKLVSWGSWSFTWMTQKLWSSNTDSISNKTHKLISLARVLEPSNSLCALLFFQSRFTAYSQTIDEPDLWGKHYKDPSSTVWKEIPLLTG